MTNKVFETLALTTAIGLLVVNCAAAVGQPRDVPLTEAQQRQLAEDILSGEGGLRQTSVLIAQRLGVSRMSEDVRVALIDLLMQLNSALQVGARDQVGLESIANGEFYLSLADTVAALRDPRAIPALVQVGNYGFSRAAGRGLASFGEQALPSMIEVLDDPASSGDLVAYNVMALSAMVHEPEVAAKLSPAARNEIARIARNSLGSVHGAILLMATELAVALTQPELTQMVTAVSQDSRMLTTRGVGPETAELVRKYAADTLARISAGASGR
jgi:hypothetical protein